MGFQNIKKKSETLGKKSTATILKVNKYENPQKALDLIAHICTTGTDIDIDDCFNSYLETIDEFQEKADEVLKDLPYKSESFADDIREIMDNVASAIEQNPTCTLNIAIAGGFSAGKSSFINQLSKAKNLLPTGIEPVSVVNTYINFSQNQKEIEIKGENLQLEIIRLSKDVLDCIQHSSSSKVYIASVLQKLILDMPITKDNSYLNGVTFIDTPGYNNSSAKNAENGKTDSETAEESFDVADVIFWCVDIESGTISEKDFEVLKNEAIKDKPLVIIFTKMDKKSQSDIEKILSDAEMSCLKKLGKERMPWAIMAFSCLNGKSLSLHKSSLPQLIEDFKIQCDAKSYWGEFSKKLKNIFEKEKKEVEEVINDCKKERKDLIDEKNEDFKLLQTTKEENDRLQKGCDIIKRYPAVLNACDIFLAFDYVDICERIYNQWYNDTEERYKECQNRIKIWTNYLRLLKTYEDKALVDLKNSIELAERKAAVQNKGLSTIKEEKETDIFSAISGDNMDGFLSCISEGIDLTICNPLGYSPLTWTVKCGNNAMVDFFIKHEVDLSLRDKRGYNVLETAAMCHYQDLCEMLIEADKSLISQSVSLVELAKKNDFINWISKY